MWQRAVVQYCSSSTRFSTARLRRGSVLFVFDKAVVVVVVRRQGSLRVEARSAVLERETHLVQLRLDLVDGLGAEVADVEQVLLGAGDELTHGVDALTLEAVVRADRELQVLDRQREVGGELLVDRRRADVDTLGLDVELAGQPEELDEGLAGRGDGVAGTDRRLGLDVDHQPVEVRALLDTSGLDLVGDLEDRRVDRVDRHPADLVVAALVLHRGDVATAALDDQLHLELALLVERGDLDVGVVHLDAGGRRDVRGGDLTRALLAQVHGDRLVVLGGDDEILEVQDHLGDVLLDPVDRGELVEHAIDPDAGDRGTGDRGQQGTTKRVAERVAEAGLERLDDEPRAELVDGLFRQGRALSDKHWLVPFRAHPLFDGLEHCCRKGYPIRGHAGRQRNHGWGFTGAGPPSRLLLRVVLDDELFLDRDVDLLTDRELVDQDSHAVRQGLHPARHDPLAVGLASHDERSRLEGLLLDVDHVVLADLVRRDVDLLAVDLEVAVHDELAGGAARLGEPGAVHHVVEPALEELQQVVTGLAGSPAGLGVVVVKLLLEHAVGESSLLLLTQLEQVLALLDPAAAVLAGRVGATLVSLVAADEVDT